MWYFQNEAKVYINISDFNHVADFFKMCHMQKGALSKKELLFIRVSKCYVVNFKP